jgi:hypothetical protein
VDYDGMKADPLFLDYVNAAAELQKVHATPSAHTILSRVHLAFKSHASLGGLTCVWGAEQVSLSALGREERMAFFINIYNALIVHGTVVTEVPDNLLKRLSFFSSLKYNIGGQDYSAGMILLCPSHRAIAKYPHLALLVIDSVFLCVVLAGDCARGWCVLWGDEDVVGGGVCR